jgi:hypothetical protein
MYTRAFLSAFVVVVCALPAIAGISTQVQFDLVHVSGARWQCDYTVNNISLSPPINEFTIWFNFGSYDNLVAATPAPLAAWDEITWQPDIAIGNGGYDAKALSTGVSIGESVGSFSVQFDWLGAGTPGPQFYEIINPTDFTRIDSGFTVPEPVTLAFLGLGGLCLRRVRCKTLMY